MRSRFSVPASEYSVVSQDLFGLRFQITPVIPSLIGNPILGH